jgi:hypothetical protein
MAETPEGAEDRALVAAFAEYGLDAFLAALKIPGSEPRRDITDRTPELLAPFEIPEFKPDPFSMVMRVLAKEHPKELMQVLGIPFPEGSQLVIPGAEPLPPFPELPPPHRIVLLKRGAWLTLDFLGGDSKDNHERIFGNAVHLSITQMNQSGGETVPGVSGAIIYPAWVGGPRASDLYPAAGSVQFRPHEVELKELVDGEALLARLEAEARKPGARLPAKGDVVDLALAVLGQPPEDAEGFARSALDLVRSLPPGVRSGQALDLVAASARRALGEEWVTEALKPH